MKTYRYVTIYADFRLESLYCEFVHFATTLPEAIKNGRAYVRKLNQLDLSVPGGKRYHYWKTFRSK